MNFGRSRVGTCFCRQSNVVGAYAHIDHVLKDFGRVIFGIAAGKLLAVQRADRNNFKHNVWLAVSCAVYGSLQSFFVLNVFLIEFGYKQRLAAYLADIGVKPGIPGRGNSCQRNIVNAVAADFDCAVYVFPCCNRAASPEFPLGARPFDV